jgi:phage tail-like protein
MARAQSTDFLHSFRFQVVVSAGAPAGDVLDPEAGFNTCTVPELSLEVAEYKEGIHTYRRKYPGLPSVNDVTMTRGVAKSDSKFFDWVRAAVEAQEYRTDIDINHFHREDFGEVEAADRGTPSRQYRLENALPIRVKLAGDLDGASSDVSIQELDVAFEKPGLTTS